MKQSRDRGNGRLWRKLETNATYLALLYGLLVASFCSIWKFILSTSDVSLVRRTSEIGFLIGATKWCVRTNASVVVRLCSYLEVGANLPMGAVVCGAMLDSLDAS